MKITLVRHGEIDNNYLGAYNGHIDIGLSKHGNEQALELAKQFKNEKFDAYFCSDLIRARETLKPFRVKAVYTSKLREKSWGRHEGLRYDVIVKQEGIEYESFDQWLNLLDGENYLDFIQRVRVFFFEELPKMGYENIFVMTHAGVIRVLYHLHQDISLQEAFSKKFPYASYAILSLT